MLECNGKHGKEWDSRGDSQRMDPRSERKGWKVNGQVEQAPTTGTQHYQLMVLTPQTRFSAIKRAFPTGHIEIARNRAALAQYVTKTDTRVGQLVDNDEKYPSAARFWVLIYKHNNTRQRRVGRDG